MESGLALPLMVNSTSLLPIIPSVLFGFILCCDLIDDYSSTCSVRYCCGTYFSFVGTSPVFLAFLILLGLSSSPSGLMFVVF